MKKSTFRMIITAAFVVLFWSAGAVVAQTGCSKTTSAEIVAAIKAQFETDTEIKDQMRHVNISVQKRYVKLEGWLDGKTIDGVTIVDRAIALAKTVKCVKKVTSLFKEKGGGSCGPGQRICGDTCIDRRSECTIGN